METSTNSQPPAAPGVPGAPLRGRSRGQGSISKWCEPAELLFGRSVEAVLGRSFFELPMNLMLTRMRQQHPVVIQALARAIEDEPAPWEGRRTAGTLVVLRPLAPTPWVEAELAARAAVRAEDETEVEARVTDHHPGIRGENVNSLDDAAAVVARLLSALERIDDLERMASGLPAQVDRRDYQEQQDQLRRLASSETERVAVQSTYMHGQGPMVSVVGTLRAVPDEAGLPLHLLLEAEERPTH